MSRKTAIEGEGSLIAFEASGQVKPKDSLDGGPLDMKSCYICY